MSEIKPFNCITETGKTLANWRIGIDGDEFELSARCENLRLQERFAGSLPNNGRNTGEAPVLQGNWAEVQKSTLDTFQAALENNSVVFSTKFEDRYAHQAIRTSTAERLDAIIAAASNLSGDDKAKYLERAFRDVSTALRALEGDVFLLQNLLGAAIIRIDNLEAWSVAQKGALVPRQSNSFSNPQDPPVVPFPDMNEAEGYWDFGSDTPVDPLSFHNSLVSHRHGSIPIGSVNADYKYHQGYHSEHRLKRFWNAARAAGVAEPSQVDPQSPESFSEKKYNQGEIPPKL